MHSYKYTLFIISVKGQCETVLSTKNWFEACDMIPYDGYEPYRHLFDILSGLLSFEQKSKFTSNVKKLYGTRPAYECHHLKTSLSFWPEILQYTLTSKLNIIKHCWILQLIYCRQKSKPVYVIQLK